MAQMSAASLELPEGVNWAIKVDGMREIRTYDVAADMFIWRWDTIINGEQFTHFEYDDKGMEKMLLESGGTDTSPLVLGRITRERAYAIFYKIANRSIVV